MKRAWREDAPANFVRVTPMPIRLASRFCLAAAYMLAAWLTQSPALAATAMAVYRGDVPATTSTPGRKVEMRLKADGTMSLVSDYRNNRAPVTEEGRWNPISVEQIDVILERKDGQPMTPGTLHFVKQGDVLQATPESASLFGGHVLQLRQTKSAAIAAAPATVVSALDVSGLWRWEGMVSSGDKVDVDQPDRYTLDLQGGGKAAVRADCNRGQAAYKFDGRAAAFKMATMTRSACGSGSLAERFVKSLEAVNGHRVRGDSLYLDLPGEGGTMKFVRAGR